MTIRDIQNTISGGSTVRSVIESAIERAKQDTHNALISVVEDRALQRADEIDASIASGDKLGRLAGVPFVAKDNILTFGSPTTAASSLLETFEAPYQATVIEKLEHEGAICIGKANLDAFAHGGSTENSYFGPTTNAVDETKVAGGSSGGSAVVVATDIVPFSLGTDTGGSIRQPASFNGVVGLKPTYGTVSRYGAVSMASSTDVIGPIATTVEDISLVYEIISGVDERDGTTIAVDEKNTVRDVMKMTIGFINELQSDGVDPEVQLKMDRAKEICRRNGHEIVMVDMPMLTHALAVYYIVVPAELSSNLARYDGIKYGTQIKSDNLVETYKNSRSAGFMDENKRRILIGNYVLSSGYFDAYYKKAQTVRTMLIAEYAKAFESCDVLLGPVTPTPAFSIGEKTADPLSMYLADTMTVGESLAGLSSLSVPAGVTASGLPIGLQISAPMKRDFDTLAFAKQWEIYND